MIDSDLIFSETERQPIGKRSDPNWTQTSIFLRKDNFKLAQEKLKSRYGKEKTISDLIDALIDKWLKEEQQK